MSLDYDLTRIPADRRAAYPAAPTGEMNHVTQSLIFATMATGIGEITEATAREFYFRLSFWNALHDVIPDARRTYAEVLDHIGLRTNVFPAITRNTFLKRMGESHESNHVYYAVRNHESAQKGAEHV